MKPRVYVETSVVSYLKARASRDTVVAAHQALTRKWWDERASRFELVASELVYREASAGDPDMANARLDLLAEIRLLAISTPAVSLAEALISKGPIPQEYAEDALHVAVAAAHGVDYLITWNCKHLANAAHRSRIEGLVDSAGYACPIICTPEELMED